MGMFDQIRCEYPLPDSQVQDAVFQTKTFDSVLDDYTITRDGRLIHHTVEREVVPEHERPYYGKPEWERPLFQILGSWKSIPTGDVEVPFHGDLIFYTSTGSQKDGNCEFYEYQMRFTEGRVQWVKRLCRE